MILTRANFSQVVRLTVSDLPPDVTGTFTVSTLPEGAVASTLLLNAARTAVPGTYAATVTATAQGVNSQAVPLSITITRAPTIFLTTKPESLSVVAGGSGSVTIDIERTNYTGNVSFESEGAPDGVTTTFPDSPTTGSLATATFQTSTEVLPGVYVFAINGFAQGLPIVNTFVQLAVLAPLVSGLDVMVSPEVITLMQGTQDSATVTIDRRNYAGAITLSAAGLPHGAVASFNPPVTTGSTATVTLFAGTNTPVGAYALAVIATGAGVPTTGANLNLVVTETPALTLMAQPESLSVAAGDSIQGTLTLIRTNLPGEVQLSATGLPAGVSLRFGGNPTLETVVPFTFVVDAAATPGSYIISLHARASRIVPVEVTVTLTVR